MSCFRTFFAMSAKLVWQRKMCNVVACSSVFTIVKKDFFSWLIAIS